MTTLDLLRPLTTEPRPYLDLAAEVADQVRAACASALAGNGPTVAATFADKAQGQALLYDLQGAAYALGLPLVFYPRVARGEVTAAIMVRVVA